MTALENTPENNCFGCGPSNPRGLHLTFERLTSSEDRDVVTCAFIPKADETGWPGLFHEGLHQFVLFEASYWAALTLGGKVHQLEGKLVFEHQRLPKVGRSHRAEAWISERTPTGSLTVKAASFNDKGAPCGRMESSWVPSSRAAVERAGLHLPAYLLEEMDR